MTFLQITAVIPDALQHAMLLRRSGTHLPPLFVGPFEACFEPALHHEVLQCARDDIERAGRCS